MKKILFICMVFLRVQMSAQSDTTATVHMHVEWSPDYFPEEMTIEIYQVNPDMSLTLVASIYGGDDPTVNSNGVYVADWYLPQGCYWISVTDDYGDGFGFGGGYIQISWIQSWEEIPIFLLLDLVDNYNDPIWEVFCLYLPEEIIVDNFPGCTDPSACNYDIDAIEDDGSCEFTSCLMYGCTDTSALNYNPDATTDDGSCLYVIAGCMDDAALNYNFEATVDDGSCIYPIVGCMNYAACNYDPTATINNGCDFVSCIVIGCTDPWAFNFNPDATQPNFLDPYFGCEYWIPTEISVVQTCNDFTFTASASDGSPMPFVFANIYNWTIGNDISVEMVGPSISYSLTEDGMYIVVFIYSQGAFITSVQVDVTVATIDSVTLAVSNDTLFCETQNADWYLWSLDGEVFNQSSNPWMVPTETGVYTCTAVNNEGCMVASNDVAIDLEPIEITCCTGDFNCDGFISVADLVVFIADYGCSGQECIADFDHNNIVGVSDLMQFISLYGTTCPN